MASQSPNTNFFYQMTLDVKKRFKGVSNWILGQEICDVDVLVAPVGATTTPISIVLDSVPCHRYDDTVEISRELGLTEVNSIIWHANFQKYMPISKTLWVARGGAAD